MNEQKTVISEEASYQNEAPVGVHCILEMYQCSSALLDDAGFVDATVRAAAEQANSTLLSLNAHKFDPHGVTAIALLAESHLSIHTWPERGYAAVDIFTCGEHTNPQVACQFMIERFGAGHFLYYELPRGRVTPATSPITLSQEFVLCR